MYNAGITASSRWRRLLHPAVTHVAGPEPGSSTSWRSSSTPSRASSHTVLAEAVPERAITWAPSGLHRVSSPVSILVGPIWMISTVKHPTPLRRATTHALAHSIRGSRLNPLPAF
ncbi:hypothetical protein AAFF_G00117190 [Aldrovandia affinis]|uniref:Uncharacterized protein n=1 Tax=Aldrovandia affinis TaxID=143900 RepID=A0AAD7WXN8_9TELE|nr:hypothetical protein AAFF_G00117190 [Aldrovandia affinis]